MKVKIPHNQDDDLSYYPGLNHSGDIEIEFDEYIWLIHGVIDNAVANGWIQQKFSPVAKWHPMKPLASKWHPMVPPITGQAYQIYGKLTIGPGYVYAPYIPVITGKYSDLCKETNKKGKIICVNSVMKSIRKFLKIKE